jgi:hypothetical protein
MKNLRWLLSGLVAATILWNIQSCSSPTTTAPPSIVKVDQSKDKIVPKKGVTGILVNRKKEPMANSMVLALLGGSEEKKTSALTTATEYNRYSGTDSVLTDSTGRYVFESLVAGNYNLQGNYQSGSLVVLIRDVKFDGGNALVEVPTDTLRAPGKISGRALLLEQDNGGIICYVPGTSYLAITDDSGSFVLSNIPQGKYTIAYRKEGWKTAKDTGVVVISGQTTELRTKNMEADPAFPPPAPSNLHIIYDTLNGVATIKWKPVVVSDLAGYVVYRNLSSSTIPERISPLLLTDTTFKDTIFKLRMDPKQLDLVFRIKSQDADANLSTSFSKAVQLQAPSPMQVLTTIGWTLFGTKGDIGKVGDSVSLVASYSNPSRRILKVSWFLDKNTEPIRTSERSASQGKDSLKFTSSKVGPVIVHIEVKDETGEIWKSDYQITFSQDIPVANPPSAEFKTSLSIRLTTPTAGAKIYYTLDGTVPDTNSKLYTEPLVLANTTTLKAISNREGWRNNEVLSEVYSKILIPSYIEILDENGGIFSDGFVANTNTFYTAKIYTPETGFSSISPVAITKVGLDSETLVLTKFGTQNGYTIFSGLIPFSTNATAQGNNKTEVKYYDSLIVRWTNPTPDLTDIAEKHIFVRPAPTQGRAYFSTKLDGSDVVDQYLGTETVIYLFVVDEILPSGLTPKVTLETTPKLGAGRPIGDKLILDLVPVVGSPGKYRATIPVTITTTPVLTDANLQLAVEDLIKATYTDPMDADIAVANAGYGIAPELDAVLQFIDKNGNILPTGSYYNPAEGKLYLTYSDDWAGGLIGSVTVVLAIVNKNGEVVPGPAADAETFKISLKPPKHVGSTGVWEGSINLKDLPLITPNNGIAETYVLGTVTATVISHNKAGGALTPTTNVVLVAYPNLNPEITIDGPGASGVKISSEDKGVVITIKDQSISSAIDTLYATLSCTESADKIARVMLIEKAGSPGTYESILISKSEGPAIVNGALECKAADKIKVVYTDPVYEDVKTTEILVKSPLIQTRIYFSASVSDTVQINSINASSVFYATVVTNDPSSGIIDQIQITFTSPQGEIENFLATETGPKTGIFKVPVPCEFTTSAPVPSDKKLEATLIYSPTIGVRFTGSVVTQGITTKSEITLIPILQ